MLTARAEDSAIVEYEVRDAVAWIHLNRPHRLNAVIPQLIEELGSALLRASDDGVGAAVIAGRGRAFCAGYDLKHERGTRTELQHRRQIDLTHDVTRHIRRAPFAVIASVQGYALGNGCEFALASDYVIASDDAEFGFPEVGWDLSVTGGLTALLVESIGVHRAKDLILRGERFSAIRAHELGLVGRLAKTSELERVTAEVAAEFAGKPMAALVRAKRAIDLASTSMLEAAYALETEQAIVAAQNRKALPVNHDFGRGSFA
jgi:2-(1,2-epoxy-1,2-dihydrophenyl)acetyl-CoA isomerase